MQDHYLNSPGTEWEYNEVTNTGKQGRVRFPVPLYMTKGTIVCYEGKGQRDDTVFVGDPTPDMLPLDDEAKKISAARADAWEHPIESLPPQTAAILPEERARKSEPRTVRRA